jgi:hypothetical protein
MEHCVKTGAYVYLIDYGLFAPADIFSVGTNLVVRFNGDLDTYGSFEPAAEPTHVLYLNSKENYWRKDLGIAVVDQDDLTPTPSITKDSA